MKNEAFKYVLADPVVVMGFILSRSRRSYQRITAEAQVKPDPKDVKTI